MGSRAGTRVSGNVGTGPTVITPKSGILFALGPLVPELQSLSPEVLLNPNTTAVLSVKETIYWAYTM